MNSKSIVMALVAVSAVVLCWSGVADSAAILAVPAPSVVTSHSSQVVARNYNGYAAAPIVAAPFAASAPLVAAPVAAAVAPAAVSAPYAYPVAYDWPYYA